MYKIVKAEVAHFEEVKIIYIFKTKNLKNFCNMVKPLDATTMYKPKFYYIVMICVYIIVFFILFFIF